MTETKLKPELVTKTEGEEDIEEVDEAEDDITHGAGNGTLKLAQASLKHGE